MKGAYSTFDPHSRDYGAATAAIRGVFREWAEVDWFVPSDAAAAERARVLFDEHQALARRHAPEIFVDELAITRCRGDWDSFIAFCKRVQESSRTGWDWKFAGLKSLARIHAKARRWSRDEAAADTPMPPRPGDLFIRLGNSTVWLLPFPKRDFSALRPEQAEWASWYMGFTDMELHESIEWQLAEAGSDVDGNPFVPLVRCYAAGTYPFSLGKSEMVLFSFEC